MSKCMTIADETIDQRDTCTDLAPKEIVEFILEEVLLSAFIILDKGCSRIGDFSIVEDFRQQFDQISILKDFEQVNNSRNQSAASQESNLISGGNADRSASLVTARGNLELIIDSFVKKEDKIKAPGECKVISEDILADNELQIQNGQIHLEKNKTDKIFPEPERQKYFDKEDIIKDEKIEIEYFNEGKLNKIYVPLSPFKGSAVDCALGLEQREETEPSEVPQEEVVPEDSAEERIPDEREDEAKTEVSLDSGSFEENSGRTFRPYVTEVGQISLPVWGNGNPPSVGRWEGDVLAQREEAVRLMEELSSGQAFPDGSADPNRPRACAFAEEDVKKMIKEIEEISFTQNYPNCEDFDVTYNPEGQGDADLESKSFIRNIKNSQEAVKPEEDLNSGFIPETFSGDVKTGPEPRGDQDQEREPNPPGEFALPQTKLSSPSVANLVPEPETLVTTSDLVPEPETLVTTSDLVPEPETLVTTSDFVPEPETLVTTSDLVPEPETLVTTSDFVPEPETLVTTSDFVPEPETLVTTSDFVPEPETLVTTSDFVPEPEILVTTSDFVPEPVTLVTTSDSAPEGPQNGVSPSPDSKESVASIEGAQSLRCASAEEEFKVHYSLFSEPAMERVTSGLVRANSEVELAPVPGPESSPSASCASADRREEVFVTDSVDIKEFRSERKVSDDLFPEMASLSENTESCGSGKTDELTLRNLELVSELDVGAFPGKRSDVIKGSRSVSDTQEIGPESNWQTQQGTISLGRLITTTSETYNRVTLDSFSEDKNVELLSMDSNLFGLNAEEKRKSEEAGNFLQDSNSWSDRYQSELEKPQNDEDPNSVVERINERLEETLNCGEANADNPENLENLENFGKKIDYEGNYLIMPEMEEMPLAGSNASFSPNESKKSLTMEASNADENRQDSSTSSRTHVSKETLNENGILEGADTSDTAGQKFKLHSQKMCWGNKYELAGQMPNEFTLTESEETLIDLTESVIQIIEPRENNIYEDSSKISFSLLSEEPKRKSEPSEIRSRISLEKCDSSEIENPTKQTYSGMTTIGPIKNSDYDPKDLTAPEIDYGKMTRITSSRTLAKDMSLFSSDVTTVKIIEEDDSSDDNLSLNAEEDRLERTSLVNRDIASLTKVQKVREVMSYQPKPEEDFEDEEALARPRLDLKDVESMTDERYKVPDVSIPLLSFEIGDGNLDAEKELMDSMGLVISGLTNPAFYEEEGEEDYTTIERNLIALNNERDQLGKLSETSLGAKESSQVLKDAERMIPIINLEMEIGSELPKENVLGSEDDSQQEGLPNQANKCGTLGSVFKKASSKLLRKESDLFTRSSKSLPREASKISATESIRSILDDCHTSASNVLKKSRSLLKNSQSLLKSISQSKMGSDHGVDQKKLSPSESDVTTVERKLSGFIKKEDFTKAKNMILTKIEKTFRSAEPESPPPAAPAESPPESAPESSPEKTDLRVAVRNERNLQVERLENFKKFAPKSPLVYKSQFVKSQVSVRRGSQESEEAESNPKFAEKEAEEEHKEEQVLEAPPAEERTFGISGEDIQEPADSKNTFAASQDELQQEQQQQQQQEQQQEKQQQEQQQQQQEQQELTSREDLKPSLQEDTKEEEPQSEMPEFIVMETIPGLPATVAESLSSEKLVPHTENTQKSEIQKEESEPKPVEASKAPQAVTDCNVDVAPCFPELDEEKTPAKTSSERKIKTKKKKFTARFRSFWCSAFGRVKTPTKKGDLP